MVLMVLLCLSAVVLGSCQSLAAGWGDEMGRSEACLDELQLFGRLRRAGALAGSAIDAAGAKDQHG